MLLKTPMFLNDWYSFLYPESPSNHPTVLRDDELEPEAISA